jgi:hypothetical protein
MDVLLDALFKNTPGLGFVPRLFCLLQLLLVHLLLLALLKLLLLRRSPPPVFCWGDAADVGLGGLTAGAGDVCCASDAPDANFPWLEGPSFVCFAGSPDAIASSAAVAAAAGVAMGGVLPAVMAAGEPSGAAAPAVLAVYAAAGGPPQLVVEGVLLEVSCVRRAEVPAALEAGSTSEILLGSMRAGL